MLIPRGLILMYISRINIIHLIIIFILILMQKKIFNFKHLLKSMLLWVKNDLHYFSSNHLVVCIPSKYSESIFRGG